MIYQIQLYICTQIITNKSNIMVRILFSQDGYYVSNEGTKFKPNYHVWVPDLTHSKCDSAYASLDLAICRCKFLARNKCKIVN